MHRQGICWHESGSAVVIRPQESTFLQTALNDTGSRNRPLLTYVTVHKENNGFLSPEEEIEMLLWRVAKFEGIIAVTP